VPIRQADSLHDLVEWWVKHGPDFFERERAIERKIARKARAIAWVQQPKLWRDFLSTERQGYAIRELERITGIKEDVIRRAGRQLGVQPPYTPDQTFLVLAKVQENRARKGRLGPRPPRGSLHSDLKT
jgi:hypothetical protein